MRRIISSIISGLHASRPLVATSIIPSSSMMSLMVSALWQLLPYPNVLDVRELEVDEVVRVAVSSAAILMR